MLIKIEIILFLIVIQTYKRLDISIKSEQEYNDKLKELSININEFKPLNGTKYIDEVKKY